MDLISPTDFSYRDCGHRIAGSLVPLEKNEEEVKATARCYFHKKNQD